MELWIRSQNKECLVKLDDYIHYFYDDRENEHGIGSHMVTLGVYESKERALEVLDEIQDELIGSDFMPIEKKRRSSSYLRKCKNI